MLPPSLKDQMKTLTLKALEREEKLGDTANDDAGATVDEHSDTWGFAWMPAIEDFVGLIDAQGRGADARGNRGEDSSDSGYSSDNELEQPEQDDKSVDGSRNESIGQKRRKRRRPPSRESSRRVPSYNETLLLDKAFHNPHALETMAQAFGIVRPFSFVLDVATDDRTWGGNTVAEAAACPAREDGGVEGNEGGARNEEDAEERARGRRWFYDTVRDRQNRLWADARVKKGVEHARKGQNHVAIDIYSQALGMCPDHDDGLVARGAAYASTGRLRQAVQDLSRALSLNPANENASNYLKETRRRMDRQDVDASGTGRGRTSEDPKQWDTVSRGSLEGQGEPDRVEGEYGSDAVSSIAGRMATNKLANGGIDDVSKSPLATLIQDGAEGDTLRKMRVLLEDERKRKRERKMSGASRGEDGYKKKSRKKEKKSKNARSSRSGHHKRDRDKRRASTSGGLVTDDDSSSASSNDGTGRSFKRRRRKKKHSRSKKKRSTARSMSPHGAESRGAGSGAAASYESSLTDDAESIDDNAHPILQRKKHSLWGL